MTEIQIPSSTIVKQQSNSALRPSTRVRGKSRDLGNAADGDGSQLMMVLHPGDLLNGTVATQRISYH